MINRRLFQDIKRVLLAGMLTLALLGTAGCGSSPDKKRSAGKTDANTSSTTDANQTGKDSSEGFVEYWHEVDVQDVHGQIIVLLNGFPVYETGFGMKSHDHIDLPMNTALVGEGNRYALRVEPWMSRSEKHLSIGEAEAWVSRNEETEVEGSRISGSVVDSTYEEWREKARKQWEEYREWEKEWLKENPGRKDSITWKEGGALDSMRAWASRNPLTVTTTFDNEAGPDFSRVFEEAPVLEDTPATRNRLKDYAMHLRDLMAEKDTSALVEEFRPSIEYSYQQGKREGESLEEFISMYREKLVLEGAEKELDFSREEVRLHQWSEGRVWQLRRADAEGLLRRIKVYVAELDGELKVVR